MTEDTTAVTDAVEAPVDPTVELPVEGETTAHTDDAQAHVDVTSGPDAELEAARVDQLAAAEVLAAEVADSIEAGKAAAPDAGIDWETGELIAEEPEEADEESDDEPEDTEEEDAE
jgi:hypothetical protein